MFLQQEEAEAFNRMAGQNARPSCVALEKDFRKLMNHKIGDSILGKVRTSSQSITLRLMIYV